MKTKIAFLTLGLSLLVTPLRADETCSSPYLARIEGQEEFLYVWTLGVEGEWPSGGEIDIMEYYRGMLLANVAWGTETRWVPEWDIVRKPLSEFGDPNWSSGFHVWRMDWDEHNITLSVDGLVMNTTDRATTRNRNADSRNPFHFPQYLLLSLAIGGANGGGHDADLGPAPEAGAPTAVIEAPVRLGQCPGQGVHRSGREVVVVVVLDGFQRLPGGPHGARSGIRELGQEVEAALGADRRADRGLIDPDQVPGVGGSVGVRDEPDLGGQPLAHGPSSGSGARPPGRTVTWSERSS